MTDLHITAAFGEYDRTWPLTRAQVPGVALDVQLLEPSDIFRRMCDEQAFDVAEMSLGSHCAMSALDDSPFVGIPAFPSRAFRHGMAWVNRDAGVRTPADLNGKRIGIREWGMTALVWLLGVLGDEHGFDLRSARWLAAQSPRVAFALPSDLNLRVSETARSPWQALDDGELDACFIFGPPPAEMSRVRPLFEDWQAAEREWFLRTRLHPVMHTVVLKRALYAEHPWLITRLFDALCAARAHARERLLDQGTCSAMLPFMAHHVREAEALLGEDGWAYGLAANERELEALCRYAHEQGLTADLLPPQRLFAAEFAGS